MIEDENSKADNGQWERDLINRLSFASLAEQRRARRWGIFFKFLLFAYLFILLIISMRGELFSFDMDGLSKVTEGHTAVIDISGVISDASEANASDLIKSLQDAFNDKSTKGVILRINSPGGSPVQSAYIYDEIRRLRKEHTEVPLYAVISDVGASGAYYVAAAADQIYVNHSTIIGSIGVLMDGFGFTGTMEKFGVERRLYTAGINKGSLDPFSAEKPEEVAHVHTLLSQIHQKFTDDVKQGRGDRLSDHPDLFSGLFWTGIEGIELGLADHFGDSHYVAREVIGAKEMVNFNSKPDLLTRFADRVGVASARFFTRELNQFSLQ